MSEADLNFRFTLLVRVVFVNENARFGFPRPQTKLKRYRMSNFTPAQQRNALIYLVLFHLVIIASSNYLVQLPFTIFGLHTTWGAFTFPFIFLATDLTVRIFGAQLARKIIFLVMLPALAVSYFLSVVFFEVSSKALAI